MPILKRKVGQDGLYRRWDRSLGCVSLPPEQQASYVQVPDSKQKSNNKEEANRSTETLPAYYDGKPPMYDEKASADTAEKGGSKEKS